MNSFSFQWFVLFLLIGSDCSYNDYWKPKNYTHAKAILMASTPLKCWTHSFPPVNTSLHFLSNASIGGEAMGHFQSRGTSQVRRTASLHSISVEILPYQKKNGENYVTVLPMHSSQTINSDCKQLRTINSTSWRFACPWTVTGLRSRLIDSF